MACPMCQAHEEHTFVDCPDAQQESVTVPLWDRTRWDRLQASTIVAVLAVVSGSPLWVFLTITVG